MASVTETAKLNYADYLELPEDGKRHEILDGEHATSPAPGRRHQRIVTTLTWLIRSYLEAEPLGEVLVAPFDVVLSEFDVVQPDLVFVAAEHGDRLTERGLQGPPDLAIEVLSESTRRLDEVVKRKRFERFGLTEYWAADPELEAVRISRRREGRLREAAFLREPDELLSTPLLPGFAAPLEKVFG